MQGREASQTTEHRPLDENDRLRLMAYQRKNRTAAVLVAILALAGLASAMGLIFSELPLWVKVIHPIVALLCLIFAFFFLARWRRSVKDLREGLKVVERGTIGDKYQRRHKGGVTWTLVIDGKYQETSAEIWAVAEVGSEAILERALYSRVILDLQSRAD